MGKKQGEPRHILKIHGEIKLPPLKGRAAQVVTHLLNAIAFGEFDAKGSLEDLAEALDTTPGRLIPTLRRLEQAGYVTVEGELYPFVYPTVAMLRHQDPKLSVDQTEQLVSRLKGS
jgi:hypothetical protein